MNLNCRGALQACEGCGAKKYLEFLAKVVKLYDPVYILRVSDDVAVAPQRLPAAVAQWVAMGTDYIGCMVCNLLGFSLRSIYLVLQFWCPSFGLLPCRVVLGIMLSQGD